MTIENIWDCQLISKHNKYIFLFNIKKHKKLKNKILKNINETPFSMTHGVTKTDWKIDRSIQRKYWNEDMENIFKICVFNIKNNLYKPVDVKFLLHNYWFHIYEKNSGFGWHTHGESNFSGVYYISLPEKKYKTEFLHAEIPIQEGNLIIFPSFLLHRSPVNMSNKEKVIISFNFSTT
jgi:hypothetical protein